jgi:SOS-response transcriptional repressor LexA
LIIAVTTEGAEMTTRKALSGRKSLYDEPLSEKVQVLFTDSQKAHLEEKYGELSTAIREVMLGERVLESAVTPLNQNVGSPIIGGAICGPFDAVVESAGNTFHISADTAKELNWQEGDVWVESHGDSMEAAGIIEGALVLMRLLDEGRTPRKGEIALVQIVDADGEYRSTIKRWGGGTPPRLLDGNDEEIELPEGVQKVQPVGVAKGIVGRV